jgi:hypothetical protein
MASDRVNGKRKEVVTEGKKLAAKGSWPILEKVPAGRTNSKCMTGSHRALRPYF